MKSRIAWLSAAFLAASVAVWLAPASEPLGAQDFADNENVVRVERAQLVSTALVPGLPATVRVTVGIDPGWHVYGLAETQAPAVKLSLEPSDWFTTGTVTEFPEAHATDYAGDSYLMHDADFVIEIPVTVAPGTEDGTRKIKGTFSFLPCDAFKCLTPQEREFTLEAEVRASGILSTRFVQAAVKPGGGAELDIELGLAKGWHVYANTEENEPYRPPSFEWELPEGVSDGGLVEVSERTSWDVWGDTFHGHEGRPVYRQTFKIADDAPTGEAVIRGKGKWQRCTDAVCTDDVDVPVEVRLLIDPNAQAVAAPAPPSAPAGNGSVTSPDASSGGASEDGEEKDEGITLGFLFTAMSFGFITVLTPCVFPLLPVTVSFFSKQQGNPLPRSLLYAAGIVFTITVIGLIFKGGLDTFSRGDAFNLFVAAVFIILSLSLFGMFDLRLPSFLIDASQKRSSSGGLLGAFFMAVTLALTSFSCSIPFLAIMFQQFDDGNQGQAVAGLVTYSSSMAAPFFVCSLFPALLQKLPRAGGWMNAVKVTMGFVEFGFAFKFLRTVDLNHGWGFLPRGLVLALWVACCIGAAIYLLGYLTLPHDTPVQSVGVVRLLFAMLFMTLALYFLPGVFGIPLAPPIEAFIQTQDEELLHSGIVGGGGGGDTAGDLVRTHIAWVKNDWDGSIARGIERERPVLFDFTGVG